MSESNISPYTNSVFEQPWWLDTVAPGLWHEAMVYDGDRVIARLPYVCYGKKIHNPSYTQTLGIWMADELQDFQSGNSQLHRQKEVIAELLAQLPKAKSIDLSFDHNFRYVLPFRWHGFRIETSFSYRIEDLSNIELINKRMGKTVQKNIKAAQRNLMVDDTTNDVATFLDLQRMTYLRQHRKNPIDDAFTEKVINKAIAMNAGKLMIAEDQDGIAHGAVFLLYDERTCYYLLSGQNPQFKSDGSQNLLLQKAIEFASGVSKAFDFEGSMVEGIENFFRQFGGEQVNLYHVSKRNIWGDLQDIMKPKVKRLIGYRI